MEECEKEMLDAIKSRRNMVRIHISITKALELNGMEQYREVCINRLKEYIDGEYILGDFFNNFDIQLDEVGMKKTKKILTGYMPADWIDSCIEYVRAENDAIEAQNAVLMLLRSADKPTLKNLIKDPVKYFENKETQKRMILFVKAELRARGIISRVSAELKLFFAKWRFFFAHAKVYLGIFKAVKHLKKADTGGYRKGDSGSS